MNRRDIVMGLRSLGIKEGDILLVHSSLGSLGNVDGGADTVINALMEVIGESGTLVMPTFASPDKIFDRSKSPTRLGRIPDEFWRRKGVVRSMHPTHSVAAWGFRKYEVIADHEKASDAYGENTPYKRIADWGGYILLLGVDLDRCTMLHTVEALLDAPYLRRVEASYVDEESEINKIKVERMAGPHRNFIGLNKAFLDSGIMIKGKIGNALCRLIKAGEMLELCIDMMKEKPDLMLCDNPACIDCERQRGAIRRRLLSELSLPLIGVNSMEISDNIEDVFRIAKSKGLSYLELSMVNGRSIIGFKPNELHKLKGDLDSEGFQVCSIDMGRRFIEEVVHGSFEVFRAIETAKILGAKNIVFSVMPTIEVEFLEKSGFLSFLAGEGEKESIVFMLENMATPVGDLSLIIQALARIDSQYLRFAYNPAHYGQMGGHPFLDLFYGRLIPAKRFIGQVYLNDAISGSIKEYAPFGEGHAEIKELLSILSCRGFQGFGVFKSDKVPSPSRFKEESARFWRFAREVL